MERVIRVLHVDDDPEFAELARTFLERSGNRICVDIVTDAPTALERVRSEPYDCILSDYDMPEMSGIEFLTTIRDRHERLPFILFTGKGSEEVASDAISAGVTDYLQKEGGTSQFTVLANRIENAVDRYRARRAVSETERKLVEIAEESDDVLFMLDGDLEELLFINSAHEQLWDVDTAALEADPLAFLEVVHEDDRDRVRRGVEATADGRPGGLDFRVRDPTGRWRWVHAEGRPVSSRGQVVRLVGYIRDITEFRRRERELKRMHERTEVALEHTDSMIFEVDAETGDVVSHGSSGLFRENPNAAHTWQHHLHTAVHTDDREAYRAFYEQLTAGQRDEGTLVYRGVARDGTIHWLRDTIRAIEDDGRRRLVGFAQNVTEQTTRQRELEDIRERLKLALSAGRIGIWEWEAATDDIRWSASLERLLDIESDASPTTKAGCLEWVHPDDRNDVEQALTDAVKSNSGFALEFQLRTGDGSYCWVDFRGEAIRDEKDEIRLLGIVSDITERHRYRERLEQVQARTRELMHTKTASETAELAVRAAAEELDATAAGYFEVRGDEVFRPVAFKDPEGLFEQPPTYSKDPTDRAGQFIWSIVETGDPQYVRDIEADERTPDDRPVRSALLFPIESGRLFIASSNEPDAFSEPDRALLEILATALTEALDRALREEELRERHGQIETINELIREAFEVDTRARVAEIAVERASDVIGLDITAIYEHDSKESVLRPMAVVDTSEVLDRDPPVLRPDDSIAWRAFEDGREIAVDDVRDEPDVSNPSTEIRSEIIVPLADHGVLIAGARERAEFSEQDIAVTEMVARNVTAAFDQVARKAALRKRSERLERQNERLDEFASIVTHDLRTPLNIATGRLELLQADADNEHVDAIDDALDRMNLLIENLLSLARHGDSVTAFEPVDLADLCTACWGAVTTETATLELPPSTVVRADPHRSRQLLENLFRNAIEHGGENITVRVGMLTDGFYIEDDGPGISSADRDRVFDAGYTTAAEGTGFGLRIVEQIAAAHGWSIEVTDASDGGARFEIRDVEFIS